jgi:hypothetical protein
MKSKLSILFSYFIVFIFIFFISKKYFIVASMGLMISTLFLSAAMASLSYSINKGDSNDAKFYLVMTFLFNLALAFLGLFIDLKEDFKGIDFIAMAVFLMIVSIICSGAGYYYFNRVLKYKIENNRFP